MQSWLGADQVRIEDFVAIRIQSESGLGVTAEEGEIATLEGRRSRYASKTSFIQLGSVMRNVKV
jgi:hypothetical protein